jgi:hypothetical protein
VSREAALVLVFLTVPWAVVGLVAILRGYNVTVWRPRGRRQEGDDDGAR